MPETFRDFNPAQSRQLEDLRRDLGPEALRTAVTKWFQRHKNRKYAPAWIVKNRFIVRKNEQGRGAVCVLDPSRMPDHPFPKVVERRG
jgi:hypothetical protein